MTTENDINSRIERIEEKLNTLAALLPQIVEGYEQGQRAIMKLAEQREAAKMRMQRVRERSRTEKEEAEKRDIPPTPPIERKGEEEKEDLYPNPTRARANVPTIEQAKSFAEVCIKGSTPAMVDEWFAMCQGDGWNDEDDQPIRNWHRNLNRFVMNYEYFSKLRDPDRIYDCRKAAEPKVDPAVAAREKRAKEIADDLRRKGLL